MTTRQNCWITNIRIFTSKQSAAPGARLQVLGGLGQAEGVEAAVAGQRAVQPRRARRVGQPQVLACRRKSLSVLCATYASKRASNLWMRMVQ